MPWRSKDSTPASFRAVAGALLAPPVEIRSVGYSCEAGHQFRVPLNAEAEIPSTWDCRRCDLLAELVDPAGGVVSEALPTAVRGAASTKTHFERVLERRTREELQVLLDERLAILRASRASAEHADAG